ncbi:putative Signal transducing adapter molecule 2 [Monocercomonoides exilis]|uniref:putative Signal transducing adapter molecule 2 n=1 Tax=Monocercomonoides exilis TaxID=2049356 RepID=UPI00355A2902|nr:putative Signal transducing adapter molecule 2 [Monocercomonoides exilis]|eukprot:MONOS_8219.1-p1 / transcript=MONOS_8219.1 / gene=MONOS_8219 / organism=Monocercomonoides_exilis_PA203 / gene_product=Signal transducing adapter molecule 2 / transcript_product=Signal transducing adapter molecule 2 / location=Mono_scaffold00304:13102-14079(+) / protein_length=220 / sequence_SO=supercontig / SO=protein_coding / is_pseudo=false
MKEGDEHGQVIFNTRAVLVNSDFTLIANRKDLKSFRKCLEDPKASQFFFTIFDASLPFHQFTFSLGAMKMLSEPNAGGHSEQSEALSYELMHRLFSAELVKTEMEIAYTIQNWKKTDYLCSIGSHRVGVSVTRAVGFPSETDWSESDAVELIQKKMIGVCISSKGACERDEWERQILHIWVQRPEAARMLMHAYHALHPALRANTVVICTVAGNHKWIFS